MFGKNKNAKKTPSIVENPEAAASSGLPPDEAYTEYHTLGGRIFVREGETPPPNASGGDRYVARADAPTQQLVESCKALTHTLDETYGTFLGEAQARGLDEATTSAAVIDAWNTGNLPRVARGIEYRGPGVQVHILRGQVPEDLFDQLAEVDEMSGLHFGGPYGGLYLESIDQAYPTEADPDNPDAFYVESHMLPQMPGDRRYSQPQAIAALEQAYAAFPTPTAQD